MTKTHFDLMAPEAVLPDVCANCLAKFPMKFWQDSSIPSDRSCMDLRFCNGCFKVVELKTFVKMLSEKWVVKSA